MGAQSLNHQATREVPEGSLWGGMARTAWGIVPTKGGCRFIDTYSCSSYSSWIWVCSIMWLWPNNSAEGTRWQLPGPDLMRLRCFYFKFLTSWNFYSWNATAILWDVQAKWRSHIRCPPLTAPAKPPASSWRQQSVTHVPSWMSRTLEPSDDPSPRPKQLPMSEPIQPTEP